MGKNQSASNLTNIIKQDASGNITFVSGSTTLMTLNTAGVVSGSSPAAYAVTASYADSFTVKGNLTAQTLVVQTITSSVSTITGSTQFGSSSINTHQFTGSMSVSGSATFTSTVTTGGKIIANGGGLLLDLNGGSDTFLRVTGNRGNGDNLHVANIEFYNSFSTRLVGEMRGITGAGGTQSNSGQLAFYTNDNGTYAERMKIYSEGQIGIKGAATTEAAYALFTNDANTGFFNIFAGGSGTATKGIKLKVTNGSSTIDAMTITSGGNVGIGTSDPQAPLHIIKALGSNVFAIGESGTNTRFAIGQEASYTGNYINSTNIDLKIQSYLSGGSGGTIIFQTGASGSGSLATRMSISSAGAVSITNNMTVAGGGSNGVISIGDTTTSSTGIYINTQTFGDRFMKFSFQGNPMGEIYYNGTNTSYAASGSDIRLKKNIKIWDENILDLFKDINPKTFNWNFQEDTDTKSKGFIAQEMTNKFPEAYHKGDNDLYLYNPSGMVVYLIKAIQELKAENDTLKEILQRNNIQ